MTVSTETVRMAKSQPRKDQSERSDLPCHIIIPLINLILGLYGTDFALPGPYCQELCQSRPIFSSIALAAGLKETYISV